MYRVFSTNTLLDNSHPQRRPTMGTEAVAAAVERSVSEDPNELLLIHWMST